MDTILMVIKLLGGLAMFLYGMEIMGDGLKQGSVLIKRLGTFKADNIVSIVGVLFLLTAD